MTAEDVLFCGICGWRLNDAPQNWVEAPEPRANRRRELWPWFALATVVALVAIVLTAVLALSSFGNNGNSVSPMASSSAGVAQRTTTTARADITAREIQQLVSTRLECASGAVQVFDSQTFGDWAAAWVGTEPQGSLDVFRRESGRWVISKNNIPSREMTVEGFPRVTTMSVEAEYKLMRSAGLPDNLSEWIAKTGMADE